MLFIDFTISAQKKSSPPNGIASDTTVIKKQEQGFFSFFKTLFHKNTKKSSDDYVRKNKKSKSDSVSAKKSHKSEPFEVTKGSITWTSLYTQGVNLNTGVSGLYSLGRLFQGFDIYGAPMLGDGT